MEAIALQCLICHETLSQPVSVGCGHNFCGPCIREYVVKVGKISVPCPHCRSPFSCEDLRVNIQLAELMGLKPNATCCYGNDTPKEVTSIDGNQRESIRKLAILLAARFLAHGGFITAIPIWLYCLASDPMLLFPLVLFIWTVPFRFSLPCLAFCVVCEKYAGLVHFVYIAISIFCKGLCLLDRELDKYIDMHKREIGWT